MSLALAPRRNKTRGALNSRRAASARKRAQRRRERQGRAQFTIEVDEARFLSALLESGRMTEETTLLRDLVQREAGELLDEWSARWLKTVTA
jgi:hypothetical protein